LSNVAEAYHALDRVSNDALQIVFDYSLWPD